MHKKVAEYVKQAKFEPKVQILIYPQVALLNETWNCMQAMKKKRFHMEWKHLSYSDISTHSVMLFLFWEELS